jgi:hypothetical protein
MASPKVPRHKRPGQPALSPPPIRGVDLGAGMRGLARLTGNQALIEMLARRRLSGRGVDAETGPEEDLAELEERRKEVLAKLASLVETAQGVLDEAGKAADPRKAFKLLREHVELLLASLAELLELHGGRTDDVEKHLEVLRKVGDEPGAHRVEHIRQMLALLVERVARVHDHVLDHGAGTGELGPEHTHLGHELDTLAELLEHDRPSTGDGDVDRVVGTVKQPPA